MRKANKKPFIITLCIAFARIAATLALLFIPEPAPLKVTEKPTAEYTDGGYVLHGKIKNVTKDEITVHDTNFRIKISAVTEFGYKTVFETKPSQVLTLQPEEEFELSALFPKLNSLQNVKIDKIIFTPEHTGITLYGNVVNDGAFSLYALLTGIAGAGLLLIAIVSYVTEIRNTKRTNNIISQIRQTFENGVYTEGYYGNKAQTAPPRQRRPPRYWARLYR